MKSFMLKITIALLLAGGSLGPVFLAKQYDREYQVYGADTLDQFAWCMMAATALLVSALWVIVIAVITYDVDED